MRHNVERYAIFRKLPDGSEKWVSTATELEKAVQTMRLLAGIDGSDYFVRDFKMGVSIAIPPAKDETPPG